MAVYYIHIYYAICTNKIYIRTAANRKKSPNGYKVRMLKEITGREKK